MKESQPATGLGVRSVGFGVDPLEVGTGELFGEAGFGLGLGLGLGVGVIGLGLVEGLGVGVAIGLGDEDVHNCD